MNTLTVDTLQGLADLVGFEHAQSTTEGFLAAPANQQEIASVLRFASANGLVVTPVGGGTKQRWGNPVPTAIHLSLARLNRLRDHAWQDMTCTVEAGCTWSAMQSALAEHGQTVALDPLWPEKASIGGIVATNDSGALRLKYGGLRDHIIGMTVILADGTIAKTGGKVVKNVAGYDLHKLLCGSFGTLGIIAEVNFRLHPLERKSQALSVEAADLSSLEAPLRALIDSQMALSSLQLRSSEGAFALDLRLAPSEEHLRQIEAICKGLAVQPCSEEVWQTRQQLFDKPDFLLLKASMPPGEITRTIEQLHAWAAESATGLHLVAQATGLMTIALAPAPGAVKIVEKLRAALHPAGGSVVALHRPDSLQGTLDVWDCHSDALPLMHEIKRQFDPHRILNPGRFVGGI